ncbi:MAG: hypothetical protein C4586_08395 [Anaerolineaceae bacterium]|nr:MAG: hypothetical protein C4586_08395 [Anaerolineaceae bacterium]
MKSLFSDRKVYAVDLDGTLAKYGGWMGIEHIGAPVPGMLRRVKAWLKHGHEVVIFTARADNPDAVPFVKDWLSKQGIGHLEVTNEKSMRFDEIWDDRCVQVKTNTGVPVR